MNNYLMKITSLLVIVVATLACSGSGDTTPRVLPEPQIVLSYTHGCTLDNYEGHGTLVQCCIDDFCTVPELSNPTKIGAGNGFSCALDDSGVQCWGAEEHITGNWDDEYAVGGPQGLQNPRDLFVGDTFVCALDDHGVFCWGEGPEFEIVVPFLSNPTMFARGEVPCVLEDSGVVCWGTHGHELMTEYELPEMSGDISFIDAALGHACVIDAGELKCWGRFWNWSSAQSRMNFYDFLSPSFGGVSSTKLYDSVYSCAIVDGVLRCWRNSVVDYFERGPFLFNGPKSVDIAPVKSDVFECQAPTFSCSDRIRSIVSFCVLANGHFAHCWHEQNIGDTIRGSNLPKFPSRGALSDLL